jgi:integrase
VGHFWVPVYTLKAASPFLTAYINLKLLIGCRKSDMLSIKLSDLTDEGIFVQPKKTAHSTGEAMIYEWDQELRQAVDTVRSQHRKVSSIWLFHNRKGQPYIKEDGTTSGFDSIWQRFIKKALAETDLQERFREHDLRAKTASDIDLEHAQQLLGHSNAAITQKVYRRRPKLVKIASRKSSNASI